MPVHRYRDGRIKLTGAHYTEMRRLLCDLADSHCEAPGCGKFVGLASGEADHSILRGMGGARRDDRIWVPVTPDEVGLIQQWLTAHNACEATAPQIKFTHGWFAYSVTLGWQKRNLYWKCRPCHNGRHVPAKVVPEKAPTGEEFKKLLGLVVHNPL